MILRQELQKMKAELSECQEQVRVKLMAVKQWEVLMGCDMERIADGVRIHDGNNSGLADR